MMERAGTARGLVSGAVSEEREEPRTRVYVWDLVVRTTHWLIALSIVLLSVTGYSIGSPFFRPGELTMAWMKVIHFYGAIVFSVAVVTRIAWMFLSPFPAARWRQFVPVQVDRLKAMWGTLKFYVFVRKRPPPVAGHNPLAGATYVLVFALYLLAILSGFALYSVGADVRSFMDGFSFLLALFGGPQAARWVHHVIMWLLLGFAVHHVYSAFLVALVEKNGTLDSIFSGHKFLTDEERDTLEGEGAERRHG